MRPARLDPVPSPRLRCSICHERADEDRLVGCERCRTRFHHECRSSASTCPSLGCDAPYPAPGDVDDRLACPRCWSLRAPDVERCSCGERRRSRATRYAEPPSLGEVVRSWALWFGARPQAALAARDLAQNLLSEQRLDEAMTAADEAVHRAPWDMPSRQVRARVSLRRGDARAALTEMDRALVMLPGDPGLLMVRAEARLALDDPGAALADLTAALRVEASWPYAWRLRAEARRALQRLPEAERDLDEALRLEEWSADTRVWRCVVRGERGLLGPALEDAERALQLAPSAAVAWNNRGWIRLLRGELADAEADLTRAIELDPAYTLAYTNRFRARKQRRDLAGAAADATALLERAPDDPASWGLVAQVRELEGDLPAAIDALDRARSARPAPHAEVFRAVLLSRRGFVEPAVQELTRIIDAWPRHASAWSARAFARWREGQFTEALEDAEIVVLLDPASSFGWIARGAARASLGDRAGAEDDFARALTIDPVDPLPDRALARAQLGDASGADADVRQILARADDLLSPQSAAWKLLFAGRDDDARSLAEHLLAARPRDALLFHALAVARERLGDRPGAAEALARARELDADAVANWQRLLERRTRAPT